MEEDPDVNHYFDACKSSKRSNISMQIINSSVASVQNGEEYRCKSTCCGYCVLKIARDIDVNCIFKI